MHVKYYAIIFYMEGINFEKNNNVDIAKKLHLIKGNQITLYKHNVTKDKESEIKSGSFLSGKLMHDLQIGNQILLDNNSNTTSVKSVYEKSGRYFCETQTSLYEIIIRDIEEKFNGLELQNEFGSIHTPPDLHFAELGNKVIDIPFDGTLENPKDYRVYINKKALQDTLLKTNNANIFRAMNSRMFILAKVGNIHLPFYISSAGTSGKKQGEWYPFFGYTGSWLVKGSVNKESGSMDYHPSISEVQEKLNKNLIIPFKYLSPKGRMGNGQEKGEVEPKNIWFDIGEHLKYQNIMFTGYANTNEVDYVKNITGYNPKRVINNGKGSSRLWINDIISKV